MESQVQGASKPCTTCNGSGQHIMEAFTTVDGSKTYPRTVRPCNSCNGLGSFDPVTRDEIAAIERAIVATKGKNKGTLRATMTSPVTSDGHFAARAYYVWRLARFHGGKDMTMPVMASLVVNGDPFRDELDVLSESAARKYLGSDLHATMRWGRAFGML